MVLRQIEIAHNSSVARRRRHVLQRNFVSAKAGRFSDDEQQLTATEANSYELTSGEREIYRWAWEATRNR